MIQAILFDVDGVVLYPRDKYFSHRLKEDGIEVNNEAVKEFFKNEYKQIVVGKADLREEVSKFLGKWGWNKSVDELLEYWFSYENKINQEVLTLSRELRAKGIKCYLASDHSTYRADDLMNNVGLEKDFDGVFFSGYVGFTKEEPEFFHKVLGMLQLEGEEVLFIDDDPHNVEIAKAQGLQACYFQGIEDLKSELVKNHNL